MPAKKFITRQVNLEPLDYKIVRDFADENRLGRQGFSAALRMILRDWFSLRLIAKNSPWFPKSMKSSRASGKEALAGQRARENKPVSKLPLTGLPALESKDQSKKPPGELNEVRDLSDSAIRHEDRGFTRESR